LKEGIGVEKEAQRQDENRVTLSITRILYVTQIVGKKSDAAYSVQVLASLEKKFMHFSCIDFMVSFDFP